jgi:catechol 2,3-dioxygenase-like lactoylglutathione lyase family enzyme
MPKVRAPLLATSSHPWEAAGLLAGMTIEKIAAQVPKKTVVKLQPERWFMAGGFTGKQDKSNRSPKLPAAPIEQFQEPHAGVVYVLASQDRTQTFMSPIIKNHYVLAVQDARRSAGFYVEMLGFRIVNEPPGWVFVAKDNCMIMLGECPDDIPAGNLGCHSYFAYLRVEDANSYYRHLKHKGADVISVIEDKPWGMREFALRTIDGHRITIGHALGQA